MSFRLIKAVRLKRKFKRKTLKAAFKFNLVHYFFQKASESQDQLFPKDNKILFHVDDRLKKFDVSLIKNS